MAGSEVALDVENSIVKTERLVIDHWKSMTTKGKSAPKDKGNRSSRKWSTILKEIFDPQGRFYPIWMKVLGALWYFLTIQRETDCWQYACKIENGCELTTFDCDDHHTFRNITLLNELCPVNQPNTTLFDFGIFAAALQSGMLRSTDFPQKFMICFWWGLRNLSSLGQNLQTSTYAWENLFAVFVSIIGLLLFLYLIGNLQTYLQFATTRSEKLRQKLQTKDLEIDLWLSRKGLPKNLKEVIMQVVQQKLEQNKDVQVENILSVLPLEHSNFIRRYLRLATLKNVRILKAMDEKLLKAICEHLIPINYNENKDIIGEGDQLDRMLFIRQGIVRTYRTNGKGGKIGTSKLLEKGDLYGGELLNWASNQITSHTVLPISTRNVKSVSKVEAFTLMAGDLELVITKFWWHFTKDKELNQFIEPHLEQLKKLAISSIEREVHRINQAKMNKQQHTPPLAGEGSGGSSTWRQRVNVSKLRDQVSSPRSPLGAPC